jgi:hypothetical protein
LTRAPGRSTGDGTFAPHVAYAVWAEQVVVRDFDENGTQDLVISGDSGLALLFGAGDGSLSCRASYIARLASGLDVADLDHDRRMDLITTSSLGIEVFLATSR